MKNTPTFFELQVSYDWRVMTMKLSPKTLRVLSSRLLGLLFTYSRRGMYGQPTPRLLNLCVTGCKELASKTKKFDYSFLYLLGLEDQF